MTKIIFLLLSFVFMFGNADADAQNNNPDDFDTSVLSKEGQKAYSILKNASRFEETHVGIAGSLSEFIKEFGVLLEEKKADDAFKYLVKSGTNAGQLYGLSGLYFTDYQYFKKQVEQYKKNDKIVMTMKGCIVMDEQISTIVESKAENIAIIDPNETIEDFWKNNKKSYEIDIAHGGYPATFKYFANKAN